jgi:N-acetylglutamate synthase-like GNAT family acetyltransferase
MQHLAAIAPSDQITLRRPVPGDLGWVVHRQAVLYATEYGWDWTFEALVAEIVAKFITHFDDTREDVWIAEYRGAIVGSVFLMQSDDAHVAKLRMLYVEKTTRGLGIGRTLVETCVARARALGYREITLWTNDILVAARKIYVGLGFVLVDEAPHHSFGHNLVGQTWTLRLT